MLFYYCCCCVDILHEMNVKIRDKTDDEGMDPNSIQIIPTVNSFKVKRVQEQTTTFINERREEDEDQKELSTLSLVANPHVNSIIMEEEKPLAIQDPTYDRLAGVSNSNNTDTVIANKRQTKNEAGIKEDINR